MQDDLDPLGVGTGLTGFDNVVDLIVFDPVAGVFVFTLPHHRIADQDDVLALHIVFSLFGLAAHFLRIGFGLLPEPHRVTVGNHFIHLAAGTVSHQLVGVQMQAALDQDHFAGIGALIGFLVVVGAVGFDIDRLFGVLLKRQHRTGRPAQQPKYSQLSHFK